MKSISEEKKHVFNNHKSNANNLKQTEEGIVSVPTDKYEFHKRRIEAPKRDSGMTCVFV